MYRVSVPTVGIHQEEKCKLNIDHSSMGNGTVFITDNEVLWSNAEGTGIRLQYRDIAIHAISTDLQSFAEECLYVMYNRSILNTNESSDDEEEASVSELRFIPENKDRLKDMFNAMSDCQCLHPDDEDSDYSPHEEEGVTYMDGAAGEGFYTGEEGLEHLTPQGLVTMQRLEAMLAQNTGSGDNLEAEVNGLHIHEQEEEGQFDDA